MKIKHEYAKALVQLAKYQKSLNELLKQAATALLQLYRHATSNPMSWNKAHIVAAILTACKRLRSLWNLAAKLRSLISLMTLKMFFGNNNATTQPAAFNPKNNVAAPRTYSLKIGSFRMDFTWGSASTADTVPQHIAPCTPSEAEGNVNTMYTPKRSPATTSEGYAALARYQQIVDTKIAGTPTTIVENVDDDEGEAPDSEYIAAVRDQEWHSPSPSPVRLGRGERHELHYDE